MKALIRTTIIWLFQIDDILLFTPPIIHGMNHQFIHKFHVNYSKKLLIWRKFQTYRPLTIVLIPLLYGYKYLRMNLYRDLFNRKGVKVTIIQLFKKKQNLPNWWFYQTELKTKRLNQNEFRSYFTTHYFGFNTYIGSIGNCFISSLQNFPTPTLLFQLLFFFVPKVDGLTLITWTLNIFFPFSLDEWHFILEY
jgi:hypothetical protein